MKRFLHIAFVFVLCLFVFVPSSYAYENVPPISYDHYILYEHPSEPDTLFMLYFYDSNGYIESNNAFFTARQDSSGATIVQLEDGVSRLPYTVGYKKIVGDEWVLVSESVSDRNSVAYNANIIFTTDDIYSKNGDLVFPAATQEELYQIIQRVAEQEIQSQNQILMATMKVLMVCGIGLMALLVGLVLFSKLFRIYQVK